MSIDLEESKKPIELVIDTEQAARRARDTDKTRCKWLYCKFNTLGRNFKFDGFDCYSGSASGFQSSTVWSEFTYSVRTHCKPANCKLVRLFARAAELADTIAALQKSKEKNDHLEIESNRPVTGRKPIDGDRVRWICNYLSIKLSTGLCSLDGIH